ncbi:MAG: peptidylprolyl isomerase [Acidobacteriia bacterium]|nr:peptidylprolyl isomerase [Terriglobia bacterium]
MFRRFVVLITATLPFAVAADVRVVEEIAAKVNGEIVTRGELEKARKDNEQALRAEGVTGPRLAETLNQVNANALRDQIDQLLLVQKGKDLNIKVDAEINRELARIQVESKISDPEKFHDYIRENTGMTFEDYRDFLARKMLSQRVIGQEVSYRVANFPEVELRKYYDEHPTEFVRKEQVFLSQILLSTEGKTPAQAATAETKAKDLVARARKGEKFSDLVRDNSDDPETAKNGGQLPPYQRGMLVPQIENIVFKEKRGYITDPIKVPQGFLILKIEERFEAGQASFEEVKNDIQERLAAPKMEPKIREYLTRLREEAFLQIKDGYVDSGAAPGKDTRWKDVAQLKPQTTTKEEVASRVHRHKKILFIPIPGTSKKTAPAATPATPGTAPPPAPATPTAEPAAAPIKQ